MPAGSAELVSIGRVNPLRKFLLGPGLLSDQLRSELQAEGIVLLDEGLGGSITYRNYRAPREYAKWRKTATAGAIAVTPRRLVVWAGRGKHIDVPLVNGRPSRIAVRVEPPDRVVFGYDASAFSDNRSGTVEVRLRTAQAARVAQLLGGD
jgi:hypothetical protein